MCSSGCDAGAYTVYNSSRQPLSTAKVPAARQAARVAAMRALRSAVVVPTMDTVLAENTQYGPESARSLSTATTRGSR